MKILFINPNEKHLLDTELPEVLEEGIGYSPPLGIMLLAACVRKHTKWEAEIIDALAEQLNYKELGERIKESKPDVVGITVMTNVLVDATLVARTAKKIAQEINKEIKVVLGGPHVSIYPKETANLEFVDFAIAGEGEPVIVDFLKNIDDEKKLKNVQGLCFKDKKGEMVYTGQRGFIENLDEIPFPARDLVKINLYSSTIARRSPTTTMITSRGCPYRCIFCDRPHLGKKFRARSAKNVVDEMEECVKMGIGEILMYDDTFTIDRQRVVDICNEIKKRELDILWDVRARVNTVDYELLKLMKSAGCTRIHYGVESGNPEILKVINKGITMEQAEKAFEATKKAGIETLAYFMFGNPRETKETMLETIRFAKKLNPNYCHFSILIPMPATPVYEMGIKEGRLTDKWKDFAEKPTRNFKPEFWVEKIPLEEQKDMLRRAYKEFYLRPSYVIKSFFRIRSFGEFIRKAKAGLSVLNFR
jgi:radical SAM superfamily enzyme YgiQ (UPF0313 family)